MSEKRIIKYAYLLMKMGKVLGLELGLQHQNFFDGWVVLVPMQDQLDGESGSWFSYILDQ
jgi:hypothetical protein